MYVANVVAFARGFRVPRAFSRSGNSGNDSKKGSRRERLDEIDAGYRALIDNQIVGIAIIAPDKRYVKVNDRWCEMIGYTREELASVDWAKLTHPEDLAADEAQAKRVISGEIENYTLEKRYLRKNGEVLHAEISVVGVRGRDGALKYFVGIALERNQQKAAEQSLVDLTPRLIEAHEQERSRIGRQLHDDIGQRLALIALDMDLLREDNPAVRLQGLRNLRAQLNELSRDVQLLSHDLHASNLEYLGAVAGIKSWCKEFGARYKIQIDFVDDVRTPLPRVVGIALFRVIQEALQNVAKHSGTDRVEVNFRERENEIYVVIRDAGRGFDMREVSGGLGLTGMRERIRIINGTLTIESGLMRGTTIMVRVPLQGLRSRGHREIQ
jgi:two-component system sensor histidine kinase UhpB